MVGIQKQRSNKMTMTCPAEQLTRQPSNISNYEGYHGGEAASVPFTWESQPGTPKLGFQNATLPSLTPPPSYSYTTTSTTPNNKRSNSKAQKKGSSSKPNTLFQTIFPKRVTARKARVPPPPSLSSSSSFSSSSRNSSSPVRLRSSSVPSSPMTMRCPRKLDLDHEEEEEEEDLHDVPVSGLCFGNAKSRGCYSSMIKKVLLRHFL